MVPCTSLTPMLHRPRPPSSAALVVPFAAFLAVCAAAACAVAADPVLPAPSPGVHEVGPELFYMEDDAGKLVPVPGFRYRDFVDLFRMREGLAGPLQPPAAVLEKVVLSIDARDVGAGDGDASPTVTCPAKAECIVRQARSGWAMVPIDLGGLLLASPPRHDGPGRIVVDAQPGGGYRAWFDLPADAAPDTRHTVVLEGRLPVVATADHESIDIRLPAAVAGLVEVRSARKAPVVHTQPAAADVNVKAAEGGSLIAVAGLVGNARIRITDRRDDRETSGAAEAVTESTVRIDGRNAVTDAVIRLGNLAAGTRTVTVMLPSRAVLRSVRPPATLVGRGGTEEAPSAEIAVDVDAAGRAVVDLVCERPVDPSGNSAFEAIGLLVEGIPEWRQWGRVSLVVEGDWQATWADGNQLRRVDPPASARQAGFVAAFAYDAQPSSLLLRVRPRRSRVVIEPEYRYDVGGTRITLAARFRVASRGTPISSISIGLDSSWSIDEVGPAGAIDVAAVVSERGETVIPFTQALAGDTVVEVRASRPVDKSSARIAWKTPVPRADLVGPAAVIVASQSDIELVPDNEGIAGLVRQTAAAVALGDAGDTALVYRLDGAEGSFAAARRSLPRRVESQITADVALDPAEIVVDETVRLEVLHVPLEFVELQVPATVASSATFEMRQGDTLLDPTEVASAGQPAGDDDSAAVDGAATVCLRAILAEPLLGTGAVTIRYRLPAPAVPPESTVAFDLPLALPLGTSIGRQSVAVNAPESLTVATRDSAWRREVGTTPGSAAQSWSAVDSQPTLPLAIASRRSDASRRMVIEAAWLQTRLLPTVREDIRTYVLTAADDRIAMVLPASGEGDPDTVEVLLDGAVVVGAARPGGRIVVDLPRVDPARRWRLDIRTAGPRGGRWSARAALLGLPAPVRLEPPVFEEAVLERRFYWTLHVRPDEHVLGVPRQWTTQQYWKRTSWGWRVASTVSSADLATWIASTAGSTSTPVPPVPPPLAEKTFVYSGIGGPGAASPWVIPEWIAVLVASGAALAAGMAAIEKPTLRRVPVVIATAAVIGLGAVAAPEVAPLVVQAAVPGVAIAIIAWTARLILARRGPQASRGGAWPLPASSLTRPAAAPSLVVSAGIDDAPTATEARPR
ncbi:MAG: hypothetical protein ACKOC8_01030 [Pirellulales bacterium]